MNRSVGLFLKLVTLGGLKLVILATRRVDWYAVSGESPKPGSDAVPPVSGGSGYTSLLR
ncbi:hypothetical protein GOB94_12095 [Granulicella sp. 5B5]|uniref:hypothetical protein n=1 Tax=Granulicella sp. 5B5 TaxID=1617967 RepID=UPI0015F52A05|nr:hypothetical protein [Granulicella sp. 5B5]QMV19341.1 hypothetical protein GOB94_12095 [Granulicella sp. 5B5]